MIFVLVLNIELEPHCILSIFSKVNPNKWDKHTIEQITKIYLLVLWCKIYFFNDIL